jgi:hypothetical protein
LLKALAVALPDDVELDLEPEFDADFELLLPEEEGGGGAAWAMIGKEKNAATVATARTFFIFMAKTFLQNCWEAHE